VIANGLGSVVSLFSGCGGLDLGFHEEGFRSLYAADNDPAAIAVYRENIGPLAYVRDVTTAQFHNEIRSLGRADIVLGGFPCQGFSKAGPKNHADQRNILYLEMRKTISVLRPKLFVAENVDGLSQNFGGTYLRAIIEDFTSVGYRVVHRIVDAVAYGVPQHRRRVIFIGVRSDQPNFTWTEPTHELPRRNGESNIDLSVKSLWDMEEDVKRKKAVSIREALASLPPCQMSGDHSVTNSWPQKYSHIFKAIKPGQKLCNVRHSRTSVYTWQIPEVFGRVSTQQCEILEAIGRNRRHKKYGDIPNGNPLATSDIQALLDVEVKASDIQSLVELGYLKQLGEKFDLKGAMFCSGLFKRPLWDEPCPTVLTNFHNPRYFLHPIEDRPFTLRECARLQGFPDSFRFTDAGITLEDGYRLVGNAVPPPISRVLAKAIRAYLENNLSEVPCAA
jgi:DNA (cytosine-5)-methyltransferase 1